MKGRRLRKEGDPVQRSSQGAGAKEAVLDVGRGTQERRQQGLWMSGPATDFLKEDCPGASRKGVSSCPWRPYGHLKDLRDNLELCTV